MSSSQALRLSNTASVLRLLRSSGPATASDLVERTGLVRTTVHAVCGELIALGWATELVPIRPVGDGRPGRSARRYAFRPDAGFVVGVDLGVNTVRVLVADLAGTAVAEDSQRFADRLLPGDERLEVARGTITRVLARAGVGEQDVLAAAIGVPGPVDQGRRRTTARPELMPGIAGVDLHEALAAPSWVTSVDNDSNLAALGERWRGIATEADDVVMVLAGERMGAGILMDGRLVRGRDGGAGELSFFHLVEGVGNTDGIAMLARELGERAVADGWDPPSDGPVTAETVLTAAADGDSVAVGLVDQLGQRFARVAATLDTLFNPQILVFGGGVADAGTGFLPAIHRHLPDALARIMPHPTPKPPRIEASTLGDRVVVTGAVRLALDLVDDHHLGGRGAPLRSAPRATVA
ncbi:ROK family protein [Nitriliruptor alkaliphilus]|uniref:ROK family protein n=1 Tax=Nitriliruptor alkaliphilus TaxID=427918 RepID=UPI000698357B|nr:ROK family transcriptional regulator [Nitriliruptor alkaliphilus]